MSDQTIVLKPDFDEIEVSGKTDPVTHLVLVLHGILSISDKWLEFNKKFSGRFEDVEIHTKPISYQLIGPIKLMTGQGRKERTKLVEHRIKKSLEDNEYDLASIHCHSNGTKVFAHLSSEVHTSFEWIFFAGSVCHPDDDIKLSSCKENIVNDCGVKDIFPILAAAVRPKVFGHTGVVGFNNPPVTDRFFQCGHSQANGPDHFEKWIIPILLGGELSNSPLSKAPRWRLFLPKIVRGTLTLLTVVWVGGWLI